MSSKATKHPFVNSPIKNAQYMLVPKWFGI